MSRLNDLLRDLRSAATPTKAKSSGWFFKSGAGQYGEGDRFIGVTVPEQRVIAKRYSDLSLDDAEKLLLSTVHEERLIVLFILVAQFKKADPAKQKQIYDFYLSHTNRVNNWDLVDSSAEFIVGTYLAGKDKSILTELAKSNLIWDRRIAMLSAFHYIKQGDPSEAFKIIQILINDKEDLIQKAVGWMLREIGKKCGREVLENFLKDHYKTMPRTALRYAIEHFEPEVRQAYLKGLV